MPSTTNFGWTTPADTDLVKDGASAIRTLGNGIDTSFVDLKGGTTGQVLAKASNTDLDFSWVTDATGIPATIFDAKGDIIAATAADTASRLAVGSNGQVLTADSTTATGLKWAAAGGGKVLQVVQATDTSNFTTTSATFVDTGLSVTITPSSATSKVYIFANMPLAYAGGPNNGNFVCNFNLVRTSTQLCEGWVGTYGVTSSSAPSGYVTATMSTLDSPATTSATTYKVQAKKHEADTANYLGSATRINSIIAMEIGA